MHLLLYFLNPNLVTKFVASLRALKDYCFPYFIFLLSAKGATGKKTLKTILCNIDSLTYSFTLIWQLCKPFLVEALMFYKYMCYYRLHWWLRWDSYTVDRNMWYRLPHARSVWMANYLVVTLLKIYLDCTYCFIWNNGSM